MKRSLVAVALALVLLVGCEVRGTNSGVFIERFDGEGVPSPRRYALRITVHEFDEEVGGWVEYYAIEGVNSPRDPFVQPTLCTYFGPYRRTQSGFVILAPGTNDREDLQLRIVRQRDRILDAALEQLGGIFYVGEGAIGDQLTFQEDTRAPAAGCPAQARLIDRPLLSGSSPVDDDEAWPGESAP